MKLTTKITVQKIQILADYFKKENNPFFVSILKNVLEEGGQITTKQAQTMLSGPALTIPMWQNLLERFTAMGYFEKRQKHTSYAHTETTYELTSFGREAADKERFFKPQKGALELWIAKNIDWLPQPIVAIKEIQRSESTESKKDKREFPIPFNQIISLKDSEYQLEDGERWCLDLGTSQEQLTIDAKDQRSEISIANLFFEIPETIQALQSDFLGQQYGKLYDAQQKTVRISFDQNTAFERAVKIEKPMYRGVPFEPITLKAVSFNAFTQADAEKWRYEWLKARLSYIFKHEDLDELDYEVWQKLSIYHKNLPVLTIEAMEAYLQKNPLHSFYPLMKLQAPQFLTY